MTDAAGGAAREANTDLAALPPEFAKQSLSDVALILPLEPALQAIAHLTQHGRRLEQWEGWVRLRDGTRAKSLTHGGSFALARDPTRAAEAASAAMKKAHAYWERNPEYPGAALYFGLTFGAR